MRSTLKKPPPCEHGSHTRYPDLNPDGPACHKSTNRPSTCMCSSSLRTGSLFNTCTTIPEFQENVGRRGRPGWSAIITSSIMVYSSTGVSSIPYPTSASASDSPCTENCGVPSSDVYSPWSSGEYISPESLCLSESITGAQQL